jgi:release factor glutamine methyltransferase
MYKKIKTLIFPIAKFAFNAYNLKTRSFTYQDITVKLNAEIFPPKFTISTKLLLKYIEKINLNHKSFLELGCGSGIIALFAKSRGANVFASDINLTALEYLKKASKANKLQIKIIASNLFEDIPKQHFDYIFINPPYYPKNAENVKESAWFCGENFEYFEQLFDQLKAVSFSDVIMILSEDCNLKAIKNIALKHGFNLSIIENHTKFREKNFIYSINENHTTK